MTEGRKTGDERKKRVNQLQISIMSIVIILLFSAVILNVILVIKVIQLQHKVDKLYSMEQNMVVMEEVHKENWRKI